MDVRQLDKLRWQRETEQPYALDSVRQVMGIGPDVPTVRMAFVGEAPGQDEDEQGVPFVGKAGRFLHGHLKEVGIYSAGCYFTNVIDRRPPDNNIKAPIAVEAIEAQKKAFWREMQWLKDRGVQVVVALGGTAKEAFGIKEPISKCRGSIYEVSINWEGLVTDPENEPYDFVVVPTYHPSYLLRGAGYQKKNDSMTMDLKLAWREDLKQAHELASKGYTRPVEEFTYSPTVDEVINWCQDCIRREDLVAVDIETSGFSPKHDKVICIGMAVDDTNAICVPFYHTGPEVARGTRYWTPAQEAVVKSWIESLFASCPLVLQNAVFDVGYLQEAGWQIDASNVAHDTLLAHHSIASELPHNLGFITSIYGSTPYWKGEFLTRDTTIWEMDFRDLQAYNMRDCIVLHQVMPPMLEDIAELGTQAAYDESLSLIGPILDMQQCGALISRGRYNKWKKQLKENEADLRQQMIDLASLPETFSFTPAEVLLLLYGIKSKAMEDAAQWEKHREGSAVRESKRQLNELVKNVQPIWQHNYKGTTSKGGQPSLDKNGVAGLRIFASNRLAQLDSLKRRTTEHNIEEEQLRKFTKWLDLYSEWKRVQKMESMFRDLPIRQDGRIHPQLLIFGTATGRLSCLSEQSKVTTASGVEAIGNMEDGTLVLTHRGNWKAAKKIDQGVGEVYQIMLSSGRFIDCTADHKILTPAGWKRADSLRPNMEVAYVSSQAISERREKLERCYQSISRERKTYSSGVSIPVQNDTCNYQSYSKTATQPRAVESRAETSLLTVEDGQQQPYVGEDRQEAPQLERRVFGLQGVPYRSTRGAAIFQTPNSYGRCSSHSRPTSSRPHARTSYRRQPVEQRFEQLGSRDEYRTWSPAFESIVKTTFVGTVHLWDLEVEDDHSFVANEIVVHNCKNPNLQQWNKDEGADEGIREIIKAPDGHYIVAADFSNLEFRVMAYECQDEKMLQIINDGLNQHDENTRALFNIDKDSPKWKTYRQAAKTYQFASQYGAGNGKLHQTLTIRVPEANFTMTDIKRMRANFEKTYSGWADWCKRVQAEALQTRKSSTAFGRVRILYGSEHEIKNQALNNPSQGGAAHIINVALRAIYDRLHREGYRSRLQMQIHDELRFEVPEDELHQLAALIKEEMERPIDYRGEQVIFPVDIQYGRDWHNLKEYEHEMPEL